jgi:hypothetical protein
MKNTMGVISVVCGVGVSSLLLACGAEVADIQEESAAESSQALLSGTNLVFMSDVTECTTATQANSALVKNRAITGSTPILVTEGNNCVNNSLAYVSYFGVGWGSALARVKAVPGNHDYMNGLDASLFISFVRPAGGLTYRTVDVPNAPTWGVVGLDTNGPDSPDGGMTSDEWNAQIAWLRTKLTQFHDAGKTCVLAYTHHPRYTSGSHGNNDSQRMKDLWQLLYEGGVDLVLSGHDHDYERMYPMDGVGARNESSGMVQIIAGTGGATLRDYGRIHSNSAYRMATKQYGLVELTLNSGSFKTTFVGTNGNTYDAYTRNCH